MNDWLNVAIVLAGIVFSNLCWYWSGKFSGKAWAHRKNSRWLQRLHETTKYRPVSALEVLHWWGQEWQPEATDDEIVKQWEKHVAHR